MATSVSSIYFLFLLVHLSRSSLSESSTNLQEEIDYFCRFHVTNVTRKVAEQIRSLSFRPVFELDGDSESQNETSAQPEGLWLGSDVGEQPNVAEVFYRVRVPTQARIVAVNYLTLRNSLRDLPSENHQFLCTNGTYSADTSPPQIHFSNSFVLELGGPTNDSFTRRRIRRPITVEPQSRVDCYLAGGYIHPYTQESLPRYVADGERFLVGCQMSGQCQNGAMMAVSVCPPQVFPPEIQPVRKIGQCCEHSIDQAAAESAGCPKNSSSGFDYPREETIGGDLRPSKMPWQVRFTRKDGSSLKCEGVIVGKKWFLAPSLCLQNASKLVFSAPDSLKSQNVTIVDVRSIGVSGLSLAKLNVQFVTNDWTKSLQPINLPWNAAYCSSLLNTDCHLLFDAELPNPETGSPAAVALVKGGGMVEKLQRTPLLYGSPGVAWTHQDADTYFLAGLYVGTWTNKTSSDQQPWMDDGSTGSMIPVCPYLDEIRRIGSED